MKLIKLLGLIAVLLAVVAIDPAGAQELRGKWGVGGFVAYNMPMYQFGQRFGDGVNKWGINVSYVPSSRVTMEVEYHHINMSDGALVSEPFLWGITNKEYKSKDVFPDARYDMKFNSLQLSGIVHFRAGRSMEEGSYSPYIVVGAGFYDHTATSEHILYPGQNESDAKAAGAGVDSDGLTMPAVVMPKAVDTRTALAANVGFGMEMFLTRTIAVDVRGRYHFIISELRPFDQWGFDKAFPLQMIDLAAGFKFYFWD